MSRTETALALLRVAVRVPAHVFAAIAQAFDYVEHDYRQHVMAEPVLSDRLDESIRRESDMIRETGNQQAPVSIHDIA